MIFDGGIVKGVVCDKEGTEVVMTAFSIPQSAALTERVLGLPSPASQCSATSPMGRGKGSGLESTLFTVNCPLSTEKSL